MSGLGTAAAVGLAGAGVAVTAFVAHGLERAGQLQQALTNLQIATGANADEMAAFQRQVFQVSANTGQSASTIASEAAMMAKKGLNKDQVAALLPKFAAFADVQQYAFHHDATDSVGLAIQAAHLLKAYSTKDTDKMLEWFNKISYSGGDLNKVVTQLKYFGPLASTLGLNIDQIGGALATMGQTGFLSGRGGSSMQNDLLGAINAAAMTNSRQGKQLAADVGLGIVDRNGHMIYQKDHKLQWDAMIKHLQKVAANTDPIKYTNMLIAAFGKPGGTFMAAITNQAAAEQMLRNKAHMAQIPTIQKIQDMIVKGNYAGIVSLIGTNFNSLIEATFLPLAKVATPYLARFADALSHLTMWMNDHPQAALAGTLALVAGGMTAFVGAAVIAGRQIWALNAAINVLAGSAGRAAVAEDAAAIATVAGGKGGVIGRVIGAVLGLDLLKGGWSMFKGLPTRLFGSGFARPGGGYVMNERGLLGNGGKLGNFLREAIQPLSEALGDLFKGVFRSPMAALRVILKTGLGGALADIIGLVLRVGSKFVPFVGWVMLAIDALNLFKAHATDIGWVLGTLVRWMRTQLWPGIVHGVQVGMQAVGQMILNMVKWMLNPSNWVHAGGGIMQWFKDVGAGFQNFGQAFNQANDGMVRQGTVNGGYNVVYPSQVRPVMEQNNPLGGLQVPVQNNITVQIDGKDVAKHTQTHVVKGLTSRAGSAARAMGGNTASPLLFDAMLKRAQ
jgi:TP901 family phage tail tape measure protein